MLFSPKFPKPASTTVAAGLIRSATDFELTSTKRKGLPERRLIGEPISYRGLEVPRGFVSDNHSLPWPLRLYQPKAPEWWGPAWLHDYALESRALSIKQANNLYYSAMEDIGVAWHHRTVAFRGVEFARRFFPERIRRVDPDNVELLEERLGHPITEETPHPVMRAVLRKALFSSGRMALRSNGVPV